MAKTNKENDLIESEYTKLEREEVGLSIDDELATIVESDKSYIDRLKERIRRKKQKKVWPTKYTMPIILRVLCSVILLAIFAAVFTWFITWRQNLCDSELTDEFIAEKPTLFYYSILVIFSVMTAIAAITWRPLFTIGLSFATVSVISFVHMQKYDLRGVPLVPEDFLLADTTGALTQFVDEGNILRLVWGVIFLLVGSALLEHYVHKVIGRDTHQGAWWERYSLVPRVSFSLAALALLAMVTMPVLQRRNYDWITGIKLIEWNQTENYDTNGFVIAFLYNLGKLEVEKPSDYGAERMQQIAEKYRSIKLADTERVPLSDVADNVVVVLDETFYDPALLTKYYSHYGGDVTPNLHEIFKKYPSGYMYSPEYGGSTANIEFEVMSGLSNYWARITPYVNSIAKLSSRLSVASWAKQYGLDTTAIHAYDGSMYKRNLVYQRFGYDDFIDRDKMTYTEHDAWSGYINDRSVYNEILDLLNDNETGQMIAAVTMQNHGPYDAAHYPSLDFKLRGGESIYLVESSFQSLHSADEYLGEFLAKLDKLDERTVVLWFGDHAAGVLDAYYKSDDKAERDLAHLTPYFIYANFDLNNEWTTTSTAKVNKKAGFEYTMSSVDLPTTTPNCLLNEMYDILGVEKPALFYLLDTVCEESPILAKSYFSQTLPTQTEALKEYELVNYDVLAGKHYWNGE